MGKNEDIDEFSAPAAPRPPRKRKPVLTVRRRKPLKQNRKRVNVQNSESDSVQQQLRKNLRRPTTTTISTTSTTSASTTRIPVVSSQNSAVRDNNENMGGFTQDGPSFAFPDMDMDGKKA